MLSMMTRRKIGGKEYLVRNFFTGEKKLDEIITNLAVQRGYDELECSTTITKYKENRFGFLPYRINVISLAPKCAVALCQFHFHPTSTPFH